MAKASGRVGGIVCAMYQPTSGQPGDKAIVTLDGELFGWIGGSCARPMVLQEAMAAIRDDQARLIRLSSEPEHQPHRTGMTDLSMTCFSGGTMERESSIGHMIHHTAPHLTSSAQTATPVVHPEPHSPRGIAFKVHLCVAYVLENTAANKGAQAGSKGIERQI